MGKLSKILFLVMTVILCVAGCETDGTDLTENEKARPAIAQNKYVVCIDAGHGFADPGCESDFLNGIEADVTLNMAEILGAELESRGITVIFTHNGTVFPSCAEIVQKAEMFGIEYDSSRIVENNVFSAYERAIYASVLNKKTPIDLFVSLHINSIENSPEVSRYELYYYKDNPHSKQLKALCESIADNLDNEYLIKATTADESYTVTRYSDFPSLLIEAGYATNRADAKKINSPVWRRSFCKTLATEIQLWLGAC